MKTATSFAMRAGLSAMCLLLSLPCFAATTDALQEALRVERERPPAPAIERGAFVLRNATSAVTLSPDGRRVAWLHERGHNREVWLQTTAGGAPVRWMTHTPARQLAWTSDSRWLLLESPQQLSALAVGAGNRGSGIVTALGGPARREFLRVDDTLPAAVIVRERPAPGRDGASAPWRLLRVDMHGRRTVLHQDRRPITGFALDRHGRLAWLQRLEDQSLVLRHAEAGGRWREVLRCARLRHCAPVATAADDRDAILIGDSGPGGDNGGSLQRVLRLGVDGRLQVLHEDPRGVADVDTLTLDPVSRQPLIVAYRSGQTGLHGLDAATQAHLDRIETLFAQRDLRIDIGRGSAARWLIEVRASQQQGARWHLYEPVSRTATPLFDDAPLRARDDTATTHIADNRLAKKLPMQWQASDGMRLHGFLTVPPGRDAKTLPLVVMVHGGPWNHARPEFDASVQFLANRGYAVFEPNFRGSTGYGHAYLFAANGDFGNGRVQRDIVEGTRHVLASGVGDARRVGIVGASFGGYSSLLGVTFQPELFKVGVAFVPPPDFGWTLRWMLRNPESLALERYIAMADWLRALSLDTADRASMARLRAQSPLANVARMHRPVLLVAGGEDRRVGIAGVVEYAARLKLANRDVSLLVDADAGHHNREPVAREAGLYLLETMLHRHLGGPAPAPADARLQAFLGAGLRLCGGGLTSLCRAPAPTGGRPVQPRNARVDD